MEARACPRCTLPLPCPEGRGTRLDGGDVREMEESRDLEVLDPEKQTRIKARMEQARLDLQGRLRATGASARAPRLGVTIQSAILDPYL